jgi:hemerythrin-like domain-containing protein
MKSREENSFVEAEAGQAMYAILPRLRQNHRNALSVLAVVEREAAAVEGGEQPDADVLDLAIVYFRQYFTLFHQPKEELIFGHLIGHAPNCAREVFRLLDDHRALLERIGVLERAFGALKRDDRSSTRRAFCRAARFFVDHQREHVSAEEKFFYVEVERWLTAEQWAEVDRYMPNEQDPLSREAPDPSFAKLRSAISEATPVRSE